MRKILIAAVLATLPSLASAACTWSTTERGSLGVCDTTPVAPSAESDGLRLGPSTFQRGVSAFVVHVETAGTMTAGGVLQAYLYNPVTSNWNRVADGSLDFTVSAVARQSFTGFLVSVPYGRIAYVASGAGVTTNIYLNAAY